MRDRSGTVARATWATFAMAALSVIGRFVFRHPKMKGNGYGWDDWSMLLTFDLLVPLNTITYAMTTYGLGKDIWNLNADQITDFLHLFWCEALLLTLTMASIKISILLLYLRI